MSEVRYVVGYVPVTQQLLSDALSNRELQQFIRSEIDEAILTAAYGPRLGPPRPAVLRGPSLWTRFKRWLGVA